MAQMKVAEVVKKHKPRFLIATNFDRFCAYDLKTDEPLDITYVELASKFDFFLPWAGIEKSKQATDSPADVKAAEKMARLYDLILEQNPVQTDEERHGLNVFLTRLLFCYFAEDTTIFEAKLFSKSIESHTSTDCREWFIAPIDCIELAIQLLINGEIVHYRYDGDTEQVLERES